MTNCAPVVTVPEIVPPATCAFARTPRRPGNANKPARRRIITQRLFSEIFKSIAAPFDYRSIAPVTDLTHASFCLVDEDLGGLLVTALHTSEEFSEFGHEKAGLGAR